MIIILNHWPLGNLAGISKVTILSNELANVHLRVIPLVKQEYHEKHTDYPPIYNSYQSYMIITMKYLQKNTNKSPLSIVAIYLEPQPLTPPTEVSWKLET